MIRKEEEWLFSVPVGGRGGSKIKSYGHIVCNDSRKKEILLEKERLFYVAMTRAKESLALFIPNSPPEQNSWLDRASFFEKQFVSGDNKILLEKQCDEKNIGKLKSWKLNEGIYKTDEYCFCVKSSESMWSQTEYPGLARG